VGLKGILGVDRLVERDGSDLKLMEAYVGE